MLFCTFKMQPDKFVIRGILWGDRQKPIAIFLPSERFEVLQKSLIRICSAEELFGKIDQEKGPNFVFVAFDSDVLGNEDQIIGFDYDKTPINQKATSLVWYEKKHIIAHGRRIICPYKRVFFTYYAVNAELHNA